MIEAVFFDVLELQRKSFYGRGVFSFKIFPCTLIPYTQKLFVSGDLGAGNS